MKSILIYNCVYLCVTCNVKHNAATMSWKIYLIVISNALNVQISDIPKKIGLKNLKPQNEISLMEAQYNDGGISIGKYEDKIIIVSSELVFDVLENPKMKTKNKLIESFPKSQITTIVSAYLVYGLSIIDNGYESRKKMTSDSERVFDYGEKTMEEIECYNETLKNKDLINSFKEEFPKNYQTIIEEYSFENSIFRITKRFFGKQIDEDGSAFENIKMTYYK